MAACGCRHGVLGAQRHGAHGIQGNMAADVPATVPASEADFQIAAGQIGQQPGLLAQAPPGGDRFVWTIGTISVRDETPFILAGQSCFDVSITAGCMGDDEVERMPPCAF